MNSKYFNSSMLGKEYSQGFLVGVCLLILLYASIMSRGITEPFYGIHSWGQAHTAWLSRSHVRYGLGYTKGLHTWAVGMPPTENPSRYLDHPQLSSLLSAIPLLVFGINDWAQRLGALIIAVLGLLLLFFLLRRLYGETVSILAGSLYILFPITGYFYWIGYWLFPVAIVAFWCYLTIIDGFKDRSEPRLLHFLGLGTSLFVMVQLTWAGFMYAAAIGTHYVIISFLKKSLPDLKMFLILLLTPLFSLALIFTILIAARGWNYEQMIDLYNWRSTLSNQVDRTAAAWWVNFFKLSKSNFTLPVIFLVGFYITDSLIQRYRCTFAMNSNNSDKISQKSIKQNSGSHIFQHAWIFLMPGVFYTAVFTEALWVHQYIYRYFSLFVAISASLAILRIWEILLVQNLALANTTTMLILIAICVYCATGLNKYHDIEWYPPKQIEMFVQLKNKISPDQSLLSYESYKVNEHPAKGVFYRPEVAWYLDREIVVARSLPEIQKYAATGQFNYYLIANTRVPLFHELKKRYGYEYIQGRIYKPSKAGMSSFHIFNLRNSKN